MALRLSRPGGEAAGNLPDIGVHVERVRRKLDAKLLLTKKLARAAEAASMFHASRILMELSLELEGSIAATASPTDAVTEHRRWSTSPRKLWRSLREAAREPQQETPRREYSGSYAPRGIKLAKERKHFAEQHRRFKFSLFSTIRLVLFESVPSLTLTVAFLIIEADMMGPVGMAKTVMSTIISAIISISLGVYCWSTGWKGKITALLTTIFTILPLVKLAFAFACDSHIVSLFTFQCIDVEDSGER